MKINLLLFVAVILLLPMVLSEVQTLGTFKQNNCVYLTQTCGNCSYVNISSIVYPDSLMQSLNVAMEQHGSTYNYTFCNTSKLGQYIVNTEGDGIPSPYDFKITTTGYNNGNLIPLFLLLGGFLVLAISLYQRNEYFGFFSASIFIIAGIYMLIFGFGIVADTYTQTIAYISLGIGLIVGFGSIFEMLTTESGGGESED